MSRPSVRRPKSGLLGRARAATLLVVLLAVISGEVWKAGFGTICSFGVGWLSVTCPLGFLQLSLAAKDPLPQLWPSVALGALSIAIAGRYFCAWLCPTALLQTRFGRAALRFRDALIRLMPVASRRSNKRPELEAPPGGNPERDGAGDRHLARYGVLGGALASSFVFGFPVFCAACPIGLFFGALFAVKRLFFGQEPGWELLLFPAIVAVEVLFARSWCGSLCPLGALLGLFAPFNRILRPWVDREACLRSRGANCTICERACTAGIALASAPGVAVGRDCTKCLSCYEKCPAQAIKVRGPATGSRNPRPKSI